MEKKKKYLLGIGIVIVLLCVVGVTYAYWTLNLQQTEENNLTSSCFKVELLDEKDPILLQKAYPVLDSEAESLIPYTFTLKNDCEAIAKYQINLEILEDTTLESQYVKYMLNEVNGTKEGKYLEEEVETTIPNANLSYKLETGYLESKKEKHYELRIYLDGEITAENKEVMNQSFLSKISITASYAKEKPKTLEETILALPTEEEISNGNSGLYEVDHSNANITYTEDPIILSNLKQKELRFAGPNPKNYITFGEVYDSERYHVESCNESGIIMYEDTNLTKEECEEKIANGEYDSEGVDYNEEDEGGSVTYSCVKNYEVGDPILWRIIGLVNTPEGQMIKIRRNDYIGEYKWDEKKYVSWNETTIRNTLNEDFYSTLPKNLQNKIGNVTWNIGAIRNSSEDASVLYEFERGDIGIGESDLLTWKGKIGLTSASDFQYAYGISSYDPTFNWMFDYGIWWTMIAEFDMEITVGIFGELNITEYDYSNLFEVYPTLYLKQNLYVTNGDGSIENPYQIF